MFMGEEMKKKKLITEALEKDDKRNACPNCGSNNISYNLALEEQGRSVGGGCFLSYIIIVFLLFISIIGWILLIAMIIEKKKTKSVTYCLCSQCGYSWKLEDEAELKRKKRKKRNKKIVISIIIVILVIGAIIEFYFMAKYRGWI